VVFLMIMLGLVVADLNIFYYKKLQVPSSS